VTAIGNDTEGVFSEAAGMLLEVVGFVDEEQCLWAPSPLSHSNKKSRRKSHT